MNLAETLIADIKTAMKSGDKLRLETLRMIRAAVLEFEKSGVGRAMGDDDALKILNNAAKKRRDAIEQYDKAGRTEQAAKERAELAIIQEYLPEMMSEADVRAALRTMAAENGITSPGDVGKLMGPAMKALKGKADGTMVQRIAKEILGAG